MFVHPFSSDFVFDRKLISTNLQYQFHSKFQQIELLSAKSKQLNVKVMNYAKRKKIKGSLKNIAVLITIQKLDWEKEKPLFR